MALGIYIDGLSDLLNKLKDLPKEIQDKVDGEMTAFAFELNAEQAQLCPVDTGNLRRELRVVTNKVLNKEVYTNVEYAPYIEFGTGNLVDIQSEELNDIAAQFKGKGIRQINRNPQPFFFPPFFSKKEAFLKKLKDIFNK